VAAGVGLFPRMNTSGTRAAVAVGVGCSFSLWACLGVGSDCSGAGVLVSSRGGFAAGFCVSSYYMEKTRRRVCVVSYYME